MKEIVLLKLKFIYFKESGEKNYNNNDKFIYEKNLKKWLKKKGQ